MATQPSSFEDFRVYLSGAVDQLAAEMAQQQVNYRVPSGNVLALVERVADLQHTSVWTMLESWGLRHALPVHDLIGAGVGPTDVVVLQKRLRDLLGYVVLGLVLCEKRLK